MTSVLALLGAVLLFVVRAVLILLGVVLVLALLALLCPFCADLAWEGDPDGEDAGTLQVKIGALGLTFPVYRYPPPPPPPEPAAEPAKPGFFRRVWTKLKEKWTAWRQKRAAKAPPEEKARPRQTPAEGPVYPGHPLFPAAGRQKADPGGVRRPAGDQNPCVLAGGGRGRAGRGRPGLRRGPRLAVRRPGGAEPVCVSGL